MIVAAHPALLSGKALAIEKTRCKAKFEKHESCIDPLPPLEWQKNSMTFKKNIT